MATIHIEPDHIGRWRVRHDEDRRAISEHDSVTEAERAAQRLAIADGSSLVLLHDRYSRIHVVPTHQPRRLAP